MGEPSSRETVVRQTRVSRFYFLRALDAELFELFAAPARFFPPEDLTVRPLRPSL